MPPRTYTHNVTFAVFREGRDPRQLKGVPIQRSVTVVSPSNSSERAIDGRLYCLLVIKTIDYYSPLHNLKDISPLRYFHHQLWRCFDGQSVVLIHNLVIHIWLRAVSHHWYIYRLICSRILLSISMFSSVWSTLTSGLCQQSQYKLETLRERKHPPMSTCLPWGVWNSLTKRE